MIPSTDEIAAAHEWLRRRYLLTAQPTRTTLDTARNEALSLAVVEDEEPAAIFFALARRGRSLADAWALLPDLLALAMLGDRGRTITASREELRSLRVRVAMRSASWIDVRDWFATHVGPSALP